MSHPQYLLLHKREWEKLKNKVTKKEEPKPKDDYIKNLVEKSQAWVKTWPDSIEGCAKRLEEQRENRRKENKALLKAFSKKLPKDNTSKEIKKARQLIFDNSCYGKQLCGSVQASKVVEERVAQIKFNNELKQKLLKLGKEQSILNTLPALNVDPKKVEMKKRMASLEIAEQNKEMATKRRELERKLKEDDVKCNKIDADLIKNITDQETQEKLNKKLMEKRAIEEFQAERNKYEQSKEAVVKLNDALTGVYRKEKDRLKCKIDKINKKIITDKQNYSSNSKQVYNTIEILRNQEIKAYEDFVEKGVKAYEEKQKADEEQQIQKINQTKQKRIQIEESLKTKSEMVKEKPRLCERSSIPLKSRRVKPKGPRKLQTEYEFNEPYTSLLDGLRQREKEKSPWNGTKAAHAQFAEEAAIALKECKHKQFVRKVIDDYRKMNNLDTKTLPIPDYEF